jgi:hypothetical protein
MPQQVASVLSIYIVLLVSMIGNIMYFVYSTQAKSENWTRYGSVPSICFGLVVVAAIWAVFTEKRTKLRNIKYHASNQIKIVFVLVIGGIFSAVQTSAQWLVESTILSGFLHVLLIGVVIYVLVCLIKGLVELWVSRARTEVNHRPDDAEQPSGT